MRPIYLIALSMAAIFLGFCSSGGRPALEPGSPGEETGEVVWMRPESGDVYQQGIASWYGKDFNGKRTANGEIYDMYKLTAAHKELEFHTIVEVENLDNGRKVLVRINDRGPFIKDRIIDLSLAAARRIGSEETGTAPVRLRIVKSPGGGKPVMQPSRPGSTAPREPETKTGCYLQAGAFGEQANARRILHRLSRMLPGIKFRILFADGLYKVVSDPFPSRDQAEEASKILEEYGVEVFVKETGH